jgi:MATE family multidrug resistance protein
MPKPSENSLSWHVRRTLILAGPIIVARASFLVMAVVDTIMTGWSGTQELAYLALGIAPQLVLMLIGIGAIQAIAVLTAQAIGAGEEQVCGQLLRAGVVLASVLGLIFLVISFAAAPLFELTGQIPDIATGAMRVTLQFAWGMPALLIFVACNHHLEATDRPKIGMYIMITVNVLNVPFNGIFALGWGGFIEPMGAAGAIFASSLVRWLAMAAVIIYIARHTRAKGDPYRIAHPHLIATALREAVGPKGRQMFKIGLPMGLAQGVESAAFSSLMFIAGLLGVAGLATHQVTMTVTALVYMMALGTMSATAIRVGNAVGRLDGDGVRRAGWVGLCVGAAMSLPPSVLFLAMPQVIASAFTDNQQVLDFSRDTIRVAGAFLAIDAMMGIAIGALRGLGDVWAAFYFQAGSFWLIGIPLAWYLVIVAGSGPVGLIFGIFTGVAVSFILLAIRFHRISLRPLHRA